MAFLYCNGFEMGRYDVGQLSPLSGISRHDIGGVIGSPPGPWSNYFYDNGVGGGEIDFGVSANSVYLGWHWYINSASGGNNMISLLDSGGTSQILLRYNSGAIQIYRGDGTLLATSSLVPANTWFWFEIFLNIADSGGEATARMDMKQIATYTGDTRNAGNANIGRMNLGGAGSRFGMDDFVMFDGTGTYNNTWPGPCKVKALHPNADGSRMELKNKRTTVNRFYIGTPWPTNNYPTDISPAFDSGWERTASARRYFMSTDPRGSDIANQGQGHDSRTETFVTSPVAANDDVLTYQFISPPIAAQTVSGTFKGQIRVQELAGADDERIQCLVKIVSNDGSTVRGTLVAMDTGALASEFSTTTVQNRKIPKGGGVTMSSVAASDGDRIVVELGVRHHGSTTSDNPVFQMTDNNATDLPEDETTASDYNAWVEFSNAITLSTTTGNWQHVNEAFGDDDTWVYETTQNDADLYNLPALSQFDAVAGVTVWARARRGDAGPGDVQVGVRQGATESWGSDTPLPVSWFYVHRSLDNDPTDSAQWTVSKVNSLEIGVKVR